MHIAIASCETLPDWEVDDRFLHEALRRRGLDFTILAWDRHDANWSDFDACLIRTTWDYMERQAEFVAWAKKVENQTTLFNPAKVVEWNTHKRYLCALAQRGVPIAPTLWYDKGETVSVREFMANRGWSRGFIKPQVGATARETMRFEATPSGLARAQAHVDRLLCSESLMIQPYLSRVENEGERSLIFFNDTLSHAVEKCPMAGDYRVQDDFGASDYPVKPRQDEVVLAEAALSCMAKILDLQAPLLYARVDILRTDQGAPVLNELEVVEPSLFFRHSEAAGCMLADALWQRFKMTS